MRPTPRRHARLLAATVATAAVGAVLPLGAAAQAAPTERPRPVGVPSQAAERPEQSQRSEHPQRSEHWQRPEETVDAHPAAVVAEAAPRAGARTPLRVVTVRDLDGTPRIEVERVRGRDRAVATVEEAQDQPGMVAVEVDTRVRAVGTVSTALAQATDPGRSEQWGLDRLAANEVWDLATGEGAVVAVVDSGVDGAHPDLAGRLTAAGYDFVTGGGDGRVDENSHGTHVAGVVAAVQGNGIGVAGLAPGARIMPIRVLDAQGAGWSSDIARGITYAVDHGADVVNLSLGGPHQDSVTAAAVNYALSKGVTVVAAVGNDRSTGSPTAYPAAYPGVLGVASIDRGDSSSSFSSIGSYVDIAAPGGRILSTVVGGYGYMSGTSMATPFVSATAALAVAASGSATGEVAKALTGTATDLGPSGWDQEFGHGLVSPVATVRAVSSSDEPTPTTEPEPAEEAAPQELRLTFGSRGGRALVGQRRAVMVRVTDVTDGSPVAGQRVVVVGRSRGQVVAQRWVETGADGRARAVFRIRATTRFSVRSPATPSTAAASNARTLTWRAAPRVRSRHVARRALVRVLDDRGQRVKFQRASGGRWVKVAVRSLDGRGRAVVRGLPRGRIRATVTRVPGLVPVRTRYWTVG